MVMLTPGHTPTFVKTFPPGGSPAREDWYVDTALPGVPAWVHLDRRDPASRTWLRDMAQVDDTVADALFEEDTQPRFTEFPGGTLLILRTANRLPDAAPEDMVSLRLWITKGRVITTSGLPITAVELLSANHWHHGRDFDPADLVVQLATQIARTTRDLIKTLDDEADALEETILAGEENIASADLLGVRRQSIWMRRFLAPQTEALEDLADAGADWITPDARVHFRETAHNFRKLTDSLDAIRDHAIAIQDQLAARTSEKANRTLYLLTLAAAIFLPVNLIAALLGANVGGIPGAESPLGFLVLSLLTVGIIAIEVALFMRLRLL